MNDVTPQQSATTGAESGPEKGVPPAQAVPSDNDPVWGRVMALAVLATAANLWCERHLGVAVFDDPVGLVGGTSVVTAATMILDASLNKAERDVLKARWREQLRGAIRVILATPVLALLYFVGIGIAATFSSVTLIPPSKGDPITVEITDINDDQTATKTLNPGSDAVRILLSTSPLGRNLLLEAAGYLAKPVALYPPVGLTIDVAGDLEPLPTFLFRPSYDAMLYFSKGGSFTLYDNSETPCQVIATIKPGARMSTIMIGARRQIPDATKTNWIMELQAQSLDRDVIARTMLAWQQPVETTADPSPKTGDSLYALIKTKVDKPTAVAQFRVGDASFQAVQMVDFFHLCK